MKTIDRVLAGGRVLINNSLRPRISVATIAKRDLPAGYVIKKAIGSFDMRGEAVNIADQPDHIPIGLVQNARLEEDIRAGEMISFDRASIPESLALRCWEKSRGI
jgi:predicted homoserine dehydrogenase-like protein